MHRHSLMDGQDLGPVWNTLGQSVHSSNCSGIAKSPHVSHRTHVAKLNQTDSIKNINTHSFTIHVNGSDQDCALVSVTAVTNTNICSNKWLRALGSLGEVLNTDAHLYKWLCALVSVTAVMNNITNLYNCLCARVTLTAVLNTNTHLYKCLCALITLAAAPNTHTHTHLYKHRVWWFVPI